MFLSVIKHNKAGMAAILIVCGISFLLVGLFAHAHHENGEDLNKIKAFSNKHAYVLVDSTPEIEMQRILTQKNASELLSEFFQSLYEDGISFCSNYGYDMYQDENGNIVHYHTASRSFFELYGLKAESGRLFSQEDYEKTAEPVPVLIGYDLKSSFELGKQYYFENPTGGGGFQGLVVGVLNKNSEYYHISNVALNESLDSSYIVPFGRGMCSPDRAISDYDMALSGMLLFLEDQAAAEQIGSQIRAMNLFQYSLKDVDKTADEALQNQKKNLITVLMLFAVIAAIVFVTTYMVFRKIIRTHTVEIGVRVLCGASVSKITAELAKLAALLVAVSVTPAVIASEAWTDAAICAGSAVLLFVLIACIPMRLINRLSVVEIVRNPNME